jgi:hypothetical protein
VRARLVRVEQVPSAGPAEPRDARAEGVDHDETIRAVDDLECGQAIVLDIPNLHLAP